jgi:plastocyanin
MICEEHDMDFLNSRHLTQQDSFVQMFAEPGSYAYYVTTVPGAMVPQHETPFELTVKPGTANRGDGRQHVVRVVWDTTALRYLAEPKSLEIDQHDHVTWHSERGLGVPPYAVRGHGTSGQFDSATFGPDAAFMHFFLQPGRYVYQINGTGRYLIDVLDHRSLDPDVYARRAAGAPLVSISKGVPRPHQLEIVAGQTVVWLAEEERGVSLALAPM